MTRRERRTANDMTRRIAIPQVFPITFAYVPAAFVEDDAVLGPDMLAIGNATYFHLGVLSSAVHVAWLCAVDKPKGTEFVYRPERTYNTFSWPKGITDEQRERIEKITGVKWENMWIGQTEPIDAPQAAHTEE